MKADITPLALPSRDEAVCWISSWGPSCSLKAVLIVDGLTFLFSISNMVMANLDQLVVGWRAQA